MKKVLFLLGLLAFVLSSSVLIHITLPTETSTLFSGSGNCTLCHSASSGVLINAAGRDVSPVYHWQSSMMANAAKDPYWLAKVSAEVEEYPHLKEVIEDKCVTCHAPMGRTEAIHNGQEQYTLNEVKMDPLSQDGVSCTLCHQIDSSNLSTVESFSGNFIIKPLKAIYGPYENPFAFPMENNTGYTPKYDAHIGSSALCATCHTLITPYVDSDGNVAGYFPEQMPYYEWLNSSYPDQDKSCQQCHMPQVNEEMRIASLPPNLQNKRNPIFEHHFVGGNTVINKMLKDNRIELGVNSDIDNLDTTAHYTLRNLKENSNELNAYTMHSDGMVSVNVELKNKTGHKLPTGFPSRRLWIHFTAKDNEGNIIFESGKYDENGIIVSKPAFEEHHDTILQQESVQVYETVLGNMQNEITTYLLEASHYIKDNRIPPIGFITGQPYDSLIAITGKASNDINFNKNEDGVQGTGSDRTTYSFPFSGSVLNYSIELCYQSIKPSYISHLSESTTEESMLFSQMYSVDNLPKLEVISYFEDQVSFSNIQNMQLYALEIYPNPSKGDVFFKGNFNWPLNCSIYSLSGTLISSRIYNKLPLSFKDLQKGSYIMQLETGQNKKSFKIVID